MRWNSGSFGHDFTYVRIHSPVRMCGSLRDVRKKACFLVRDKTQCAQIYCKNDVADYKKEIHGYKKWELFSILFIIPYLCRVFHADTSVRGVWESGKYIYIEKTFTWRFVLGTLKLRKFRLSGNFWLVIFKIRYLCLPLFYETRTTPSCHSSGCAYRQL